MEKIKFIKNNKDVEIPKKAHEGDEGFDLEAQKLVAIYKGDKIVEDAVLKKYQEKFENGFEIQLRGFERALFSTEVKAEIPEEIELQVRSRSGKTLKKGLIVLNSPGTVEHTYKGDIGVIVYNSTPYIMRVRKGEKIAQLVPKNSCKIEAEEGTTLTDSVRGVDGFGSTD